MLEAKRLKAGARLARAGSKEVALCITQYLQCSHVFRNLSSDFQTDHLQAETRDMLCLLIWRDEFAKNDVLTRAPGHPGGEKV